MRVRLSVPPSQLSPLVLGARLRRSGWGRPRRPAKNRVLVAQNNEISYSKGKTSQIFTGHRRRPDPKLWRKNFVICDVGMVQNQQFWPQNFESLQVSPPSLFGENRGNRPRGGTLTLNSTDGDRQRFYGHRSLTKFGLWSN